jgi:hypothetical protein
MKKLSAINNGVVKRLKNENLHEIDTIESEYMSPIRIHEKHTKMCSLSLNNLRINCIPKLLSAY